VTEPEQQQTHITLTVNRVANPTAEQEKEPDWHRVGLPAETRTYEIVKPPEPIISGGRIVPFRFQDIYDLTSALFPLNQTEPAGKPWPYEEWEWRKQWSPETEPGGLKQDGTTDSKLRLIEHVRTLYRRDDLTGLLPLGELHPLALLGQSYKLALTPGLLAQVYRRPPSVVAPANSPLPEVLLPNDVASLLGGTGNDAGGYVDLDGSNHWWIPSGHVFFSTMANVTNPAASAAQELTEALQHFFLPRKFADPFGHSSTVDYEHNLVVIKTEDAVKNTVTALHDYRVLQPKRMTDPNGNRSEAAFDALGMVVATAVRGKANQNLGDLLEGFDADPPLEDLQGFITDPHGQSASLLGKATTRMVYDLDRFWRSGQPPFASTLARETHFFDPAGAQTNIQVSFSYSDGFGREIQKKIQAEPGDAPQRQANVPLPKGDIRPGDLVLDADGNPILANTARRWVGSGRTVFNNKGKPVRQYEPFFSATHLYEEEREMTNTGVSTVLFYDPVERVVATLHPNQTWEKVVFDPWQQATYDVNDTVLNADGSTDPKSDEDVNGFFSRLPEAHTWYEQRIALAADDPERIAAEKAAVHRQTPSVAHLDTLGRTFLTIAHNRFDRGGAIVEEKYPTRVELDIEGNQLAMRDAVVQNGDALGRIVMLYDYDMLGNRIHQASMEAGERWTLNDVTGKPIRAWDSRGFMRRITYDELRRPTGLYLTENDAKRLAERTVYGEGQGAATNHRTRVYQVFDAAGRVTSEAYDAKGNLLRSTRDLLPDYKGDVNWNLNPVPSDGSFTGSTTYDALNRPTAVTTPDGSVYRPTYSEANLLDKVDVNLRGEKVNGEPVWTAFVTNVDYNAKGQRTLIRYANGAETAYEYDKQTFRLIHLETTRAPAQDALVSQIFKHATTVQDLRYTYDPAGNIIRIVDDALPVIVHNNQPVAPVCGYIYDAVYRLIAASGREHIGQTALDFDSPNFRDHPFVGHAHPNDLQAVRNYTEHYEYDAGGNFERLIHHAANGNWTRTYAYDEPSLLESMTKQSNRLSGTTIGQRTETYAYDPHGNMTSMPHLTLMEWNFKDQLRATSRQVVNESPPPEKVSETTFYVYDAGGQRVRKVTERQNGARKDEHIYVAPGFEIYRKYNGNGAAVTLERETLHVMDDKQRIALVETKTVENGNPINASVPVQRCQFANHLRSASLELDKHGGLISYEEYHPYGTTAYQAINSADEISLKRYRYTGKERDEETGLQYHGARHCASWLGRWIATDPAGLVDGTNSYSYVSNNPIIRVDPSGMAGLVIEAGSTSYRTVSEAELMEAGAEMALRIQSDLREFFGLETDVNISYKSAAGCGCGPGPGASSREISSISVVLSQDTQRQEQSRKDLRVRVEAAVRRDMVGKSPHEIHKEVESRMDKLESARRFLETSLSDRTTDVELRTLEETDDFLTKPYAPLLGMRYLPRAVTIDMVANPYTWGLKKDGSWTRAPRYSSERSRAAVSPGLQLLHEFEHQYNSFIGGPFVERNLGGFDEEGVIVKDVDKYVTAHPGIAERYWYGNVPGLHQSVPGSRYVFGKYGYGVKQGQPDPTDAEWVHWPTEDELKTGVRK
jgi:RHS repeat-associated protein